MGIYRTNTYAYGRFNGGNYGAEETFDINFAGPVTVSAIASINDVKGSGRNKIGITSVRGSSPQSFPGVENWSGSIHGGGVTGLTIGLATSGRGGCSGTITVFFYD